CVVEAGGKSHRKRAIDRYRPYLGDVVPGGGPDGSSGGPISVRPSLSSTGSPGFTRVSATGAAGIVTGPWDVVNVMVPLPGSTATTAPVTAAGRVATTSTVTKTRSPAGSFPPTAEGKNASSGAPPTSRLTRPLAGSTAWTRPLKRVRAAHGRSSMPRNAPER